MTVEYSLATLSDVDDMVYMAARINGETPYHKYVVTDVVKMTETMAAIVSHPDTFVLIGKLEGKACAMIGALRHHSPISGELGVGELFWWVDPSLRNGLGFASPGLILLRRLESWARTQGAKWLQLTAPDERIEEAYRALGYEQIETDFQKRL